MSDSVKTLNRPDISYSLLPNREMQPTAMTKVTSSLLTTTKKNMSNMTSLK